MSEKFLLNLPASMMHPIFQDEWNRTSHPMKVDAFGVWEIRLACKPDGNLAIPHNSKVKVMLW